MSVSLKWFPPSWIQIETKAAIIYIDPAYLRSYYTHHPQKIEFSRWPDPIDGLPEKLPKADLILVTHDHKDHAKSVTVNRLRRKNTLVAGPLRCIKNLGEDIRVVEPGETFSFKGSHILVVDAYNTARGSSTRKVHHKGNGVGYLITVGGKTIYHAGDTDFIPEMNKLGRVDVALLPIGGTFTMDLEEAVRTAIAIKPKVVIPMHRSKANPQEFKRKVESSSKITALTLQIGGAFQIS
jgi:L-ascorbate metabolism protein UlaG (beta-lactamase superfamily)